MNNGLDCLRGRMSERLITVADMLGAGPYDASKTLTMAKDNTVGKYNCTADVGCDHGYISMYLVLRGISDRAIAMDLRQGPLSSAKGNVAEFGISDRVSLRLSDGLGELNKGEADSLVIAGMGGKLMISILEKKDIPSLGIRTGVLQPQSDLSEFRTYLRERGYEIVNEGMVFEDGKYYFPMLVDFHATGNVYDDAVKELSEVLPSPGAVRLADRYGVYNILRRDPLLKTYLEHGHKVNSSIIGSLNKDQHPRRYEEVALKLRDIELLLDIF